MEVDEDVRGIACVDNFLLDVYSLVTVVASDFFIWSVQFSII